MPGRKKSQNSNDEPRTSCYLPHCSGEEFYRCPRANCCVLCKECFLGCLKCQHTALLEFDFLVTCPLCRETVILNNTGLERDHMSLLKQCIIQKNKPHLVNHHEHESLASEGAVLVPERCAGCESASGGPGCRDCHVYIFGMQSPDASIVISSESD